MNTDHPEIPWLPREHFENQRNFPREQLDPFRRLHIAWSWEGDRVVGHTDSFEALWEQLLVAGINPQRVVYHYVNDL